MKKLVSLLVLSGVFTPMFAEEVRINLISATTPEYVQIGTTDVLVGAYWVATHEPIEISKPIEYKFDTYLTTVTPKLIEISTPTSEQITEGYSIKILKTYQKYYEDDKN